MPAPTMSSLHLPVLEILNGLEGNRHTNVIKAMLADRLALTEADMAETVASGRSTRFDTRSAWAISNLKRAGLIDSPSRAHYEISPAGKSFLAASGGDIITTKRINELVEKRKRDEARKDGDGAEAVSSDPTVDMPTDIAPHEQMDALHRELNATLADELLGSVKGLSPPRFERLVVDLLEAMGYGEGRRIGGSGDQGIDGVINQDPLGLENVYIQAKRWQSAVGEPEIRNFLGSLDIKGASKGVFITTSTFSQSAKGSASSSAKTIRLIDGDELAELMITHNVGVIIETTYALKKPDENYFSEDA